MSFHRRLPYALLLLTGAANAQTPAPRPATQPPAPGARPAPGAQPAPGVPAPPPFTPGLAAQTAAATGIKDSEALRKWAQLLETMQSGNGLTAEEVAKRARATSADIEARRHAIRAADETVSQVKYGFWPRVTLSADYTRLSDVDAPSLGSFGGGGNLVATTSDQGPITPGVDPLFAVAVPEITFEPVLNNYTFAARLAVPFSDYVLRMSDAVAAASHAKEATIAQEQAVTGAVDRDARVAYYEWIRAQAFALIAEQAAEQATGHLTDAQNGFQAGLLSKADVMQAQARLGSAELAVERAKNAREIRRVSLAVAMHDTGEAAYQPGENVFAEAPELSRLPPAAAAYREALGARSELRALLESERSFQKQASVERVNRYPRLDGHASAMYANPNPRIFPQEERFDGTWDAGVVLSWTPTDIGGANAAASVAEARAKELAAQRKGLMDGIRIEVENALVEAAQAKYAIATSGQTLAAAEESYRVRHELFRAGRGTLTELTDAQTELTRARLELANAHIAARIALAQLHHALGRDQKPARR
ncbi:MAG TPA: TolC family protein [Polyangiaceae bacterium]